MPNAAVVAFFLAFAAACAFFLASRRSARAPAPAPAPPPPPAPSAPSFPVIAANAATIWSGVSGATVPPYVHLDLLLSVPPSVDPAGWGAAPPPACRVALSGPSLPPPLSSPLSGTVYSVSTPEAPIPSSFSSVPPGSAVLTFAFPPGQVPALQAALFTPGQYVSSLSLGSGSRVYVPV